MKEITERLEIIMNHYGLSEKGFSESIGVNQKTLNNQMRLRSVLSLDVILKTLLKYPEIDANWLLLGKGFMSHSESGISHITNSNINTGGAQTVSPDVRQLLQLMQQKDVLLDKLVNILATK